MRKQSLSERCNTQDTPSLNLHHAAEREILSHRLLAGHADFVHFCKVRVVACMG